jgi:hypothetical protein
MAGASGNAAPDQKADSKKSLILNAFVEMCKFNMISEIRIVRGGPLAKLDQLQVVDISHQVFGAIPMTSHTDLGTLNIGLSSRRCWRLPSSRGSLLQMCSVCMDAKYHLRHQAEAQRWL